MKIFERERLILPVTIITLFVSGLAGATIYPVVSIYIRSLGFSVGELGIFSAALGFGLLLSELVWAWLAYKGHIKKVFMMSCVFRPIVMVLYVFVREYYGLLFLRFFEGVIACAGVSSSRGLVAIFSKKSGRGFGLFWAIMGASSLIGPTFGGYLAEINYTLPFYAGTIFAVIAAVMTFLIPNPKIEAVEKEEKVNIFKVVTDKGMVIAAFIGAFNFFVLSISGIIPVYVQESPKLSLSILEVGFMFTIMSIAAIPSQIIFGELSDRIGKRIIIVLGLALNALTFFIFPQISSILLLYLTVFLSEMGRAATGPPATALAVEKVPPYAKTIALGIYGLGEDIGFIIGALVYSQPYQYYGADYAFYWSAAVMGFATISSILLFGIRNIKNWK